MSNRRKNRRAHKRGNFPVKHPLKPAGSEEVYYFKDGGLSMSQEVTKRVFVLKMKQPPGREDFFWSRAAATGTIFLGMATLFVSPSEAMRAMATAPVSISAMYEPVNLFEYLCTRIDARPDVVQEEKSFEELGLVDPHKIDTSEMGDEEVKP